MAPSPVVVPAREATAPKSTTPKTAATGTALAAVAKLTVKGRAPKTGYTRAQFGQAWYDTDHNGCDTRNDILRRDLHSRQMKNYCKVLAGTLAPDPYTGTSIRFVYGGASEVDIDHVVALSDAWQKGAATWPAGKRLALANDPLNLLAVDASANRAKGDGDTATWLPSYKVFRCTYVARQVAVKGKYGIWVTAAERDAMTRVLATCPTMLSPGPGSATTAAVPPGSSSQPVPVAVAVPPASSVFYANCTAARAAGAAPIHRGDPGYATKLDRDGDGIACE
ncbi:MAG: excalibur calcium-binding domain-containing protein [Actinomycetota bacterium]